MKNWLLIIAGLAALDSNILVKCAMLPSRRWSSCGYMGGRIYCYGGLTSLSNSQAADTNLYSLDITKFSGQTTESINNNWETVVPNGDFDTESRRAPAAIVLLDQNRLLIQGGNNYYNVKYVNQTIIYDTTTNSWTTGSSYTESNRGTRQIHFSTAVNINTDNPNSVGFYGGFEQLANTAIPRITATGGSMPFYADLGTPVGFASFQVYSVVEKIWQSFTPQGNLPPVNYYPDSQTATLDPSTGKVYYLGGLYYSPTEEEKKISFRWAITFGTTSGLWSNETLTSNGAFPTGRIGHTATLLPNSQDIILYGGSSGNDISGKASADYCFTLNLAENKWTERSNLNVPVTVGGSRYSHSSVLVNSTLFILFGKGSDGTLLSSIMAFDVANVTNLSYSATFGTEISSTTQNPRAAPLSNGAIGGIAAGAAVVLIAIVAIIIFFIRRKRKQGKEEQNNQDKFIVEEVSTDWDKIEGQYREVSPVGWSATNSPYSANSMEATRVGGFSPDPSALNIGNEKPSVDGTHRGYTLVKPDAK
ncbi:unnamed protein product [Mucor hiemalis]